MSLEIGTILIGKYTVKKVIGEGGFGVVYLAEEVLSKKTYAIKEYFPGQVCKRNASGKVFLKNKDEHHQTMFIKGLTRFKHEANNLHRMSHPNIIKVTEYFEENNTAFMVMSHVKGASLEQLLRKSGKLTPEQADAILVPILDAIGYIHEFGEGIIHRDINPGNILIDMDRGEPILIDFGTSMGSGETEATQFVKHGYSAVEQYSTESSDLLGFHTDVYSLAATFYHCLVGEKPPNSTGRLLSDTSIVLEEELAGSGYDPRLLKLVDLGFQIRPEKRPQSIPELRDAAGYPKIAEPEEEPVTGAGAGAAVDGGAGTTEGRTKPGAVRSGNDAGGSSKGLLATAAIALVALLGYGAYTVFAPPSGPAGVQLLTVAVEPEAAITVNGSRLPSSGRINLSANRSYEFEVTAADYESLSFTIPAHQGGDIGIPDSVAEAASSVELADNGRLSIELRPKALPLYLTSDSEDVSFTVDGEPYSEGMVLPAGTYDVVATSSLGEQSRSVRLSESQDIKGGLSFDFGAQSSSGEAAASAEVDTPVASEPRLLATTLRVTPSSAAASIEFIGEDTQPTTPYELEPRNYQVQVSAPGYETQRQTINVANQQDFTFSLKAELSVSPDVENFVSGLVAVSGGSFVIGCKVGDDGCDREELPPGTLVDVAAYSISDIEVSNALWAACVDSGGCSEVGTSRGNPDLPVTGVSFADVREFIAWINGQTGKTFRLPTEAEWEVAALAAEKEAAGAAEPCESFNFADNSSPYSWKDPSCSDDAPGIAEVRAKPALAGLHSILGNVWEFTSSCWSDGSGVASSENCELHTVKGGAFNNEMWRLRPSYRSYVDTEAGDANLGFRLVTSNG